MAPAAVVDRNAGGGVTRPAESRLARRRRAQVKVSPGSPVEVSPGGSSVEGSPMGSQVAVSPRSKVVSRSQLVAIQRSRIMAAAVRTTDELGYAETSVSNIVARARVSRRTFYEMFANRDECLAAVLDDVIARVELELERADLGELAWGAQLRAGLWVILSFLDREPALARVCVVQAFAGGSLVSERREAVLGRLAARVDEGRLQGARSGGCTGLTAEGLVGAAYMILHTRLLRDPGEQLTGLLGELVGLIVLPYQGPAAARREQARAVPDAFTPGLGGRQQGDGQEDEPLAQGAGDLLQGTRMRLTYRTVRVLESVQEHPGASNRQVAELAGIDDAGQVSKLLHRLERLELLENRGGGHAQGEPNAWQLSTKGEQVARSISHHTHGHVRRDGLDGVPR